MLNQVCIDLHVKKNPPEMVPSISEIISTSIAWKLFGKDFDAYPLNYTNILNTLNLWGKKHLILVCVLRFRSQKV